MYCKSNAWSLASSWVYQIIVEKSGTNYPVEPVDLITAGTRDKKTGWSFLPVDHDLSHPLYKKIQMISTKIYYYFHCDYYNGNQI